MLNGLSPRYLAGILEHHVPTYLLWSTDSTVLTVPQIRHCWGDHAFSRAGLVLWNNLPLAVHSASSLASFKRQLKTLLITRVYDWLFLSPTWLCISFISSLFFYLSDSFSALSSDCWMLRCIRIIIIIIIIITLTVPLTPLCTMHWEQKLLCELLIAMYRSVTTSAI